MRAHLLLLGALAACGPGRGMVNAQWQVGEEQVDFAAPGRAGWCPASGMILVDATESDRAVGVHWHFDSLAPASWALETPTHPDSTVTGASAVMRYVHLDEVRGYQSLSGELTVESIDSQAVSGHLSTTLHHAGESDSTIMTMTFTRVPLVADTTLCVTPTPAADSLAPTAATEP